MTARAVERRWRFGVGTLLATAALLAGCTPDERAASHPPPNWFTEELGGDTTAHALRGRPFHQAARTLTNAETRRFAAGARLFDEEFPEPGEATGPGGPPAALGPRFVERSCLACHADGDAVRPGPSAMGPGAVVRVGIPTEDGVIAEPTVGTQLQTRAVAGHHPEGVVDVHWHEVRVRAPGGRAELRRAVVPLAGLANGPLRPDAVASLRIAPPILGLGLLEAVPDEDIEALADPEDIDGDGISGRVARLPSGRIGRFGWKSTAADVHAQVVEALAEDLGVTTPGRSAGPPELAGAPLEDLVLYTATIAPPAAAWADRVAAGRGAAVFEQVGCAACHTPTLRTGPHPVGGLAGRTIHPFTDLLLHDLGPGLDDGLPEGAARSGEWRTAPLWGIGRREAVYGVGAFLHDGRARTITEAILWHGGEADAARRRFVALSETDRAALLAFLSGL